MIFLKFCRRIVEFCERIDALMKVLTKCWKNCFKYFTGVKKFFLHGYICKRNCFYWRIVEISECNIYFCVQVVEICEHTVEFCECIVEIFEFNVEIFECIVEIYECLVEIYECNVEIYECIVEIYERIVEIFECIVEIYECIAEIYECIVEKLQTQISYLVLGEVALCINWLI